MLEEKYKIPDLPPANVDLNTVRILKELVNAKSALMELKGLANVIPNQGILIDTLGLQEAKASSEIENIVTTQDQLFRADFSSEKFLKGPVKEVAKYRTALKLGCEHLNDLQGIIPNRTIIDMFRILKDRTDGFRTTPGTALKNDLSGEIIYVPPQNSADIITHMTNLESFINDDASAEIDPLVKMAIIHHQFESIHPFTDGNGRLGRILNILYITKMGLLTIPILYLSRYINANKAGYYKNLQSVRDNGTWEDWIVFMLRGVAETSVGTIKLIKQIQIMMQATKLKIKSGKPNLYSHDLLNNLFRHPYTRIPYLMNDLNISRSTASRYLEDLIELEILKRVKIGRENYYINTQLVEILVNTLADTPEKTYQS